MGNFAQQSLPLNDTAELTILRVNQAVPETIVVSFKYLNLDLSH